MLKLDRKGKSESASELGMGMLNKGSLHDVMVCEGVLRALRDREVGHRFEVPGCWRETKQGLDISIRMEKAVPMKDKMRRGDH
jgi:hypothetical protein